MKEGDPLSKMYVVRVGEVTCTSKGKVLPMQEAGGFSRFGEQNLVVRTLQLVTDMAPLGGQTQPARLNALGCSHACQAAVAPAAWNPVTSVACLGCLVARPIGDCVRP